jgi:hypothetical protein
MQEGPLAYILTLFLIATTKHPLGTMATSAVKVAPLPPPFYSPYLDDQCSKINSKPVPWEVGPLVMGHVQRVFRH